MQSADGYPKTGALRLGRNVKSYAAAYCKYAYGILLKCRSPMPCRLRWKAKKGLCHINTLNAIVSFPRACNRNIMEIFVNESVSECFFADVLCQEVAVQKWLLSFRFCGDYHQPTDKRTDGHVTWRLLFKQRW